jgi:peptidoglycan/xylan/chitin deacetylase (PgdA/CDA1 family)
MEAEKKDNFDSGRFVISLDFELFWGVRDKRTIESYGSNILGVQKAIPAMLRLFDEFGVKATFSTVGFLFAKNKDILRQYIPPVLPEYSSKVLSPYTDLEKIGYDEKDDPYHFGYSLLRQVIDNGNHEVGTHTFSHYYCLEPGQNKESFLHDLAAAKKIAEQEGVKVRSLVFPRNQFNESYLTACKGSGIDSFRGNPESWLYEPRNKNDESLFRRSLRFIDTYINITGHHCHTKKYISSFPIINVAASRFLRPYSKKLAFLDPLRLRRIKKAMQHAAKQKLLFHLWWHPHNFGSNLDQNLSFLRKILVQFRELNLKYGFQSKTMSGISDELLKKEYA